MSSLTQQLFADAMNGTMAAKIRACANNPEKLQLLATDYPGIGSVVVMGNSPGHEENIGELQRLDELILYHSPKGAISGRNYGIGYIVQTGFKDVVDAILSNNTRLTAGHVKDIKEGTFVHSGGDAYVFAQPIYTSAGHPRGCHLDTVYVPHDLRDGKPWYTTTLIDPKARGTAQEQITRLYEELQLDDVSPRPPTTTFEKVMSNNPPDAQLGQYNIAFSDDFSNDSRMFEHVMSIVGGNPGKVQYHTQGVLKLPFNREQLRQAKIVDRVIRKCHELGCVATLGGHCGKNSCAHCTMAICVLGVPGLGNKERSLPLDEIFYELSDYPGATAYWTDTHDIRPRQFMNDHSVIPEVSVGDFKAALRTKVFASPAVQNAPPGRISFADQYLNCGKVPEEAYETHALVWDVILNALRERKQELDDQ